MAVEALRIDGEDWSFDFLEEIENSFGITISDELASRMLTVGDLHQAIVRGAAYDGGMACPTALTFYAIRRALREHGIASDARPGLDLASAKLPSPARLRADLIAATGFALPPITLGWTSAAALALMVLVSIAGWLAGFQWLFLPAAIPLVAVIKLDSGSWRGGWVTLGSLARATAARNYATLVRRGARHSPDTA